MEVRAEARRRRDVRGEGGHARGAPFPAHKLDAEAVALGEDPAADVHARGAALAHADDPAVGVADDRAGERQQDHGPRAQHLPTT
jgi:hypothetical protein